MNYENECAAKAQCSQQLGIIGHRSPTVLENINNRIAQMEDQIARLHEVKAKLEKGDFLGLTIEDLRFAMNY